MSEKWIEYNLNKNLQVEIIDDIRIQGYQAFLTGVSQQGKSLEVFQLSKDLKNIKRLKLK